MRNTKESANAGRMKFKELDTVRIKTEKEILRRPFCIQDIEHDRHPAKWRGLITKCNRSAFGETYWIVWNDGTETIMHGDNLCKSTFSEK